MAKYLVIFKDQIDGADVNGFKVMSERDLTDFETLTSSITWGFSYVVGDTKLHFLDGDDLLTKLDYKEITNEDGKILNKLFDGEFGVFINEEFIDKISREDEEYKDEEDEEGLQLNNNDDDDDDY